MKIDEDDFLAALLPRLPTAADVVIGPGDDCAALAMPDGQLQLIAVDQVVASVHYEIDGADPQTAASLAGRKLLARNLSDIAAMGGTPTHALTAIAVPEDYPRQQLDHFMDGIVTLARAHQVQLIGGDLSRAPAAVASLTIVGIVPAAEVVRRGGAAAGDRLFVTGALGGSLASGRHLRFEPRLAEGRWLAQARLATAMIDLSDGLLVDLTRLCRANNMTAVIAAARLPQATVDGQAVGLAAALTDGEDYELLFSVAAERADQLVRQWPFSTPLTAVGELAGGPVGVRDTDGTDLAQRYGHGFQHFG